MTPTLAESILLAQSQAQTVDRLMGELARAHGNSLSESRIGNLASDAWNAGHELQKALHAVIVEAERVRCEREDDVQADRRREYEATNRREMAGYS
jgi:hypothetical protein